MIINQFFFKNGIQVCANQNFPIYNGFLYHAKFQKIFIVNTKRAQKFNPLYNHFR
jgi:hypothetical protein